jgi:hypothetical protein
MVVAWNESKACDKSFAMSCVYIVKARKEAPLTWFFLQNYSRGDWSGTGYLVEITMAISVLYPKFMCISVQITPRRVLQTPAVVPSIPEKSRSRYRDGGHHPLHIGDVFDNDKYRVQGCEGARIWCLFDRMAGMRCSVR